jgi:2-haloacid dehalogenase
MAESAAPRACVFDAYGTLFDFASAAEGCRDVLGDRAAALTSLWRDKQLQYSWLRTLQGQFADFWQVTGEALDYALETLGLMEPALRERLMSLYLNLKPFPEVADALRRLRAGGMRTAILSNGSPAMLEPLVREGGLGDLIDLVLSVEPARVYKTHPKAYQLALDALGASANELVFVSSNGWDAGGAAAFGMHVAWCNRYGQRPERLPARPEWTIRSLAELPALVLPK